jgi:hypothetical protein
VTSNARRSFVGTRVRHLVPAPIRRAAARFAGERRAHDVERQLSTIASGKRPIVVGPWLGEVGFELLYWVPFVRWAAQRYGMDSQRLIAVTRGGAATWYAPFAAHAIDALAHFDPDEFREKNNERTARFGEQKQVAMAPLDDEILEIVRRKHGPDVAVMHPSLMYSLYSPYWWGHHSLAWLRRRADYQRLPPPSVVLDLPASYTAVKFYFNDCFKNTSGNRAFVERTIRELERDGPVISLSTGLAVDDHIPCEPDTAATSGIRHLTSPQTNLLVQAAVVARARRFVGTYGGFAYLAPFYGVPADSYYSDPGAFSTRHLDLAQNVLAHMPGAGPLVVAPVGTSGRSR